MRVQATLFLIALNLSAGGSCTAQNQDGQTDLIIFTSSTPLKASVTPISQPATQQPATQHPDTKRSAASEPRPGVTSAGAVNSETQPPATRVQSIASPGKALPRVVPAKVIDTAAPTLGKQTPAIRTANGWAEITTPAVVPCATSTALSTASATAADLSYPPNALMHSSAAIPSQITAPPAGLKLKPLTAAGDLPRTEVSPTTTSAISADSVVLKTLAPVTAQTPSLARQPAVPNIGTPVPFEVMTLTKLTQRQDASPVASRLTVDSMIGQMDDPSQLFSSLRPTELPVAAVLPLPAVRSQPGPEYFPWASDAYTWYTPTFFHRPLYFEQPNLERYGIGTYRCLQPVASSAHFFTSIAILPYKTLTQHPCEKVYTLGYDRPGNCAAYQRRTLLGQSTVGEACKVWDPYSGY